ncbi:hypothetical protein BBO99_00001470 [Phytophthora kernoviae]|uniref:Uncharacterized protein n=2 Tax=Phytophthora kernoviae TaxID=325452 RepID=A0A3R7HMK9_9STRA|nr:hypothetical protein G195_003138 [Phytophthora kernoviae 00238/432]KAG2532337.1 hypothetical protein JM18_001278 [Phytophthora kernoviae]RLN43854.1 hypothetical protein BBI17_001217 [Phytophthora kernoviae]RLN84257.1 hypothetical protein BBO99_00001470 [Phytophthora kernoviae]
MPEHENNGLVVEEEEVDETFVALQKLLNALNRTKSSSNGSFLNSNSNNYTPVPTNDDSTANQQRMSREEMLENRRRERERFRHSLYSKNATTTRRRRTCPAYYCSEEEEEEEAPVPSVESTISNRFMNGSFSNLNVHVISRDRWATEDRVIERLPIVMLPKSGKVSIPTDNEKINVVQTDEFIDLREKLMHDFEELKC